MYRLGIVKYGTEVCDWRFLGAHKLDNAYLLFLTEGKKYFEL